MNLPIKEKIALIIQCLQEGDVPYLDISGSFKVDLDAGISVYLYSDIRANSFMVRFETTETDSDKRQADIETIHTALNRVITVAEVNPFQEGEHYGKRFVYTAALDFDGVSMPHEKDVIRDDLPGLKKPAPKTLTLDQKNRVIVEALQTHGIPFLDVSNSFKVYLDSDLSVYIYTEIYDNSIYARFETKQTDQTCRLAQIEILKDKLKQALNGVDIDSFREAAPCGKKFVYTARLEFDATTVQLPPTDTDDGLSEMVGSVTTTVDLLSVGEAVDLLERLDSKMLREGLDSMYLRRSSQIRVAINRIFRGVCNEAELLSLIQLEAGKIVREEDIEELQMIKTTHGDGLFKPLIALLYHEVFQGA